MRTIQLHDELVDAVLRAGAVRPETLLPPGYNKTRADAVFVDERTIVEVKSVCKDQAAEAELERRLGPVFGRWVEETKPVVFGTVAPKWEDYPAWMRHKIDDEIAPRVAKDLRDANGQIRNTMNAIDWESCYGIVAFIVPTSFKVDPSVIGRIAWNQLIRRGDHAPHIDAVMVVAAPVEDQKPSTRPMLFAPFSRRDGVIPHNLSKRVAHAWFEHFTERTGSTVHPFSGTEAQFMRMYPPPKVTFKL